MNDETSFGKIIKYKKYKEIYKIKSMEVIVSLISSIVITALTILVFRQAEITDINNLMREMTKEIAIVLIGFLGFVISGLAILTSSISNKFINILKKQEKINIIERILLSFYLLGTIVGTDIIFSLIMYISTYSTYSINIYIIGFFTFIFAYITIFIIFYSVALIGNCIEIFKIINTIDDDQINETVVEGSEEYVDININDDNYLFMNFRITALEQVLYRDKNNSTLEKMSMNYELMKELINIGCKNEMQKKRLTIMLEKAYGPLKNSKK